MSTCCKGEDCNIIGCVECITCLFRTQVQTLTELPAQDRVARGKRLLEQSNERVKRVRLEKKKIILQHELIKARDRLDSCVFALQNAEEKFETCPLTMHSRVDQNIKRLKDKRQVLLLDVIKAEEAILDFNEDE